MCDELCTRDLADIMDLTPWNYYDGDDLVDVIDLNARGYYYDAKSSSTVVEILVGRFERISKLV